MASLETRLEKLEQAKRSTLSRTLTDAERAIRAIWMIETKAPGWERLAELLGQRIDFLASKGIK